MPAPFFSKRGNELNEQENTAENQPLPEPDAADSGTAPARSLPPVLRWIVFCAAGLATGFVLAFLCGIIETQSVPRTFARLAAPGFWVTALMLGLITLTISLLFHLLPVGGSITAIAAFVITLINYYKVSMTATPLSIGDFSLVTRLGSIVSLNSGAIAVSALTAAAVVLCVLWLIGLGFLTRFCRLQWRWSVIGGVLSWGAFTVLFWGVPEALFFVPLQVSTAQAMEQSTVNDYCSSSLLGLWRGLYYTAHQSYETASLDELLVMIDADDSESSASDPEDQPNIILLLSESFFDVTELDGVSYDEDPVAGYHALLEESVSGTFYTQSLGYGTCNIELCVLTGLNTGLLSGEDLYSFSADAFEKLPSVPSVLADSGYYTAFLHTYNDSVYGRSLIYPALGFDDLYFSSDFGAFFEPVLGYSGDSYWTYMQTRIAGGLYSDELLTELIIAKYEDAREAGEDQIFLFAVSMQNHQPYNNGKYDADEITVSVEADGLSAEAMESLTAFVQGCHDASEALTALTDYYRDCEEPTIIIFFGDHRPGLGTTDGSSVYQQLGIASTDKTEWSLEDYAELYSTDYLIWANDESLLPQDAGTTLDTSCNYLGAMILELANVELPAYWQLISSLSGTRLIDTVSYHLGTDGTLSASAPSSETLNLLTSIIASALYGEADE